MIATIDVFPEHFKQLKRKSTVVKPGLILTSNAMILNLKNPTTVVPNKNNDSENKEQSDVDTVFSSRNLPSWVVRNINDTGVKRKWRSDH